MNTALAHIDPPSHYRQDVAAAVRAHMAVHQVKDAALAREIGMSQSAMSRRTNGEMAFDVDELGKIAEWFEITLAELIEMPKPLNSGGPQWAPWGSNPRPKDYLGTGWSEYPDPPEIADLDFERARRRSASVEASA